MELNGSSYYANVGQLRTENKLLGEAGGGEKTTVLVNTSDDDDKSENKGDNDG